MLLPLPQPPRYAGPPRSPQRLAATAIVAITAARKLQRRWCQVLVTDEQEYWALVAHFNQLAVGYELSKSTLGYSCNYVTIRWKF